ncbi:unnamed protein product [Macrosiphum euphorbiae]|uniref:Uncharacterized protein n=1 Tax=Macrosiphum euphorbiae TaxID=13131 RepID=A0AAV0WUC9_9HEMI|nr:unnamed protein product [Macrosiphum euphorbiae]
MDDEEILNALYNSFEFSEDDDYLDPDYIVSENILPDNTLDGFDHFDLLVYAEDGGTEVENGGGNILLTTDNENVTENNLLSANNECENNESVEVENNEVEIDENVTIKGKKE